MPDLRALLDAEATRQRPEVVPPFASITRRVARRRLRRGASASLAVAVVVAAVVTPAVLRAGESRPQPTQPAASAALPSTTAALTTPAVAPTPAATSPNETIRAYLSYRAVEAARADGDDDALQAEAVYVADGSAAEQAINGEGSGDSHSPSYILEVRGSFVCHVCSVPPGAQAPRGTVITDYLDAATMTPFASGLDDHWFALSTLGTVIEVPVPAAVATPPSSRPGPPPASASPVNHSSNASPSHPPVPVTLAEVERLALASSIAPATARLAWAEALTVAQIHAQGGPEDLGVLPANPTMYVVAVNGQAMTDGSPEHAAAVVTRYAWIVNPDGSGKGDVSCLGDFCGLPPPP